MLHPTSIVLGAVALAGAACAPAVRHRDDPLSPVISREQIAALHATDALEVVKRLRGQWLHERRKSPERDVEEGLAMAGKALEKNPHMAAAFAAKGHLYLVKARAARAGSDRAEAARHAKEAFEAAFRENPLLERERGASLSEASRLCEE